jgi:AGCS family alanine or glycine:cation symporter
MLAGAVLRLADVVWGPWMLGLLLGTGLLLSLRYGFPQVVRFGDALRSAKAEEDRGSPGVLSAFQAFATALSTSIGTGNIAGVATAVISGGPGALFWIWCYGFFATSIKATEAILGIRFRRLEGGRVLSGPMYYLLDGLRSPALAWVYAVSAGLAALTTTPFTQPNSMAVVLESQFGVPTFVSGVVIAILTWLVVIGGISSIGKAAERLAPLQVGLYLVGGGVVIGYHAVHLPEVLSLVFREAFSLRAEGGGAAGVGMLVAMRYGIARGIYANEAGFGSAAVAYGTARSADPERQGLNAVLEVFVVSCVTSTISALVILLSGAWTSGLTSTAVVASAFESALPRIGGWIVASCAFLFGYTTLVGWAYYGEQFLEYVVGSRVAVPYRWAYCGLIVFGATRTPEVVWAWGDLMNAFQILPNVVGLLALSGVAAAALARRPPRAAA